MEPLPKIIHDSPFEMCPIPIQDQLRLLHYENYSSVQHDMLKLLPVISGSHLFQSPTGSGKTIGGAILLAAVTSIKSEFLTSAFILPTLEAAIQVHRVLAHLLRITVDRAFLGEDATSEFRSPILVGTPGKIRNLLSHRKITLTHLRCVVFDEADIMFEELKDQNLLIVRDLPATCTVVALCTRISPTTVTRFNQICSKFGNHTTTRLIPDKELSLSSQKHFFVRCATESNRIDLLTLLLKKVPSSNQCIVFVNTRSAGNQISQRLSDCSVWVSGDAQIEERTKKLEEFRVGGSSARVLITTNVLSRAIDFPNTKLVVNFHIPLRNTSSKFASDTYLLRSGRCGRWKGDGVVITIIVEENVSEIAAELQSSFGIQWKEIKAAQLTTEEFNF